MRRPARRPLATASIAARASWPVRPGSTFETASGSNASAGLCVDACNHVMEKLDRPKWLIRWDTLTRQAARARGKLVPLLLLRLRTIIYCSMLLIVATAMLVAFLARSTIQLSVQHDRAPLFVPLADGSVRNGYLIRAINETTQKADFELTVEGVPGATMTLGEDRVATGTRCVCPSEPTASAASGSSSPLPAKPPTWPRNRSSSRCAIRRLAKRPTIGPRSWDRRTGRRPKHRRCASHLSRPRPIRAGYRTIPRGASELVALLPWAVAGSLGLVMVVNAGLVWWALSTFPGQAGGDGFDLSNDYDRLLGVAEKQAALGWSMAATLRDGRPVLAFVDRAGQPIADLAIIADAERPLGPPKTKKLHFVSNSCRPGPMSRSKRCPSPGHGTC